MPEKEKDLVLNPDDFEDSELDEELEEDDNSDNNSKDDEPNANEDSDVKVKTQKDKELEELHKKNELAKQKRLEREAREREKREKELKEKAKIEGQLELQKTNPFNDDSPIVDEEDLLIFKLQKELNDEGKDPIADLPKKIAEYNRKRNAELSAVAEKKEAERKKLDDDIQEFVTKYPNVDTAKLVDDAKFVELKTNYPELSTTKVYELYKTLNPDNAKKVDRAFQNKAKDVTKAPSSKGQSQEASEIKPKSKTLDEMRKYWAEKYNI